jgi:hypothetical protein
MTDSRPQSIFADCFEEGLPAEWNLSTESGPLVSLSQVPIFGVNTCPFNFGIKDTFISELTINTQRF